MKQTTKIDPSIETARIDLLIQSLNWMDLSKDQTANIGPKIKLQGFIQELYCKH